MESIRTIIVDDEELARHSLKLSLEKFKQISIIGECSNGFEAVKSINELKPDVVFLDIQMPKLNGFDVVELLADDTPEIIFVTAFDEYAINAFDANALDYLLKPVNSERIKITIERLEEKISNKAKPALKTILKEITQKNLPLQRILIKEHTNVYVIPVNEITHLEAQDDYVLIHTKNNSYLKNERISILEAELDSQNFIRLHRSFLVNIDFINRIESYSKDSKRVKLKSGIEVPVSRSGYEELKKVL
ncbi:MAG: LytTR family transcriptional regulator DNA-binding domain-containing protein [Calditrichaceae bacterium]|jgi:two-component system LytT family response regulator